MPTKSALMPVIFKKKFFYSTKQSIHQFHCLVSLTVDWFIVCGHSEVLWSLGTSGVDNYCAAEMVYDMLIGYMECLR